LRRADDLHAYRFRGDLGPGRRLGVRRRGRRRDRAAENLVSSRVPARPALPPRAGEPLGGSGGAARGPGPAGLGPRAALGGGERPRELGPAVSGVWGKRLIRAGGTGTGGGKGYEFSHILVRDAAYDRLLKLTRARMHERFAGWLLEVSGTRMPELEEIIGYHLEQSFRYRAELGPVDAQARSLGERAARHLGLAGARAIDRGDMPAAASLLQRAADLLDEGHQDRPHLLLEAGEALTDVGELAAAEATLTAARNSAALLGNDAIGRSAELAGLQLRYTTDASSVRDAVVARVRELLPVLEQSADHHGLARAWRLLTYAHWGATRFGLAAEAAEKAIRLATQAGDEVMARRFAGALAASGLFRATPPRETTAHCRAVLSAAAEDRKASARTA